MPVPDPRVELQIGGTWTGATQHVVQSTGVQLSAGRSDEGRPVDPGSGALTLLSPDGLYSNRNPYSPYFGKLPRNTLIRTTTGGNPRAMLVPEGVAGRAITPHHASLSILGDIDVRVDLMPQRWVGAGIGFELVGKYQTAGNRSWRLMVTGEGQLMLTWSVNGTSTLEHRSSVLPLFNQRRTVRATLDVDNGAGGYTLTYYIGPSLSGPWTQVGQTITTSGTTSIYNSTASLEVGDIAEIGFTNHERRIYGATVRAGINGSVVASPDFTAQPIGGTGFTDSSGRVWTIQSGAAISDRLTRTVHAVPTWPATWHRSGGDVRASLSTAGILRRLGQGKKQLASTLRRRIPSHGPLAYWPCEDGSESTHASSPIDGVAPLRVTQWAFGQDTTLASSSALPSVEAGGTMIGVVPPPANPPLTPQWSVHLFYRVDSAPGADAELFSWRTDGSLKRWRMLVRAGVGTLQAFDFEGTLLINATVGLGTDVFEGWQRLTIEARQTTFSTLDWSVWWTNIGGTAGGFTGSSVNFTGAVTQVATTFGSFSGLRVGHVTVLNAGTGSAVDAPFLGAETAWAGETAVARLQRLAAEESQTIQLVAWEDASGQASERLGPQRPGALLDLLQEAVDADGGILYEDPRRMALVYRARSTLYNQTPTVIPYAALTTPFEPSEDDLRLRNDVSVERVGGSSARVVQETGPLSVDEVGVYDEAVTLSLAEDAQAAQIAAWRLHLGTWDEARYPAVRIMLHRHPELIPAVSALQIGDRVQITGTPPWMPPGPVDLIVQRINDDIRTFTWDVVLTCSPGGPWTVGVADDPVLGRADTDGSELASGVSSSATSLSVAVTAGPLWTLVPADLPFDIAIGGEEMTVTAISGTSSPQSFTVTRSVNGITKSHAAGADVRLAHPTIAAL